MTDKSLHSSRLVSPGSAIRNPHRPFPVSLVEMVSSHWRHRSLVWQMVRREVVGRYKGSVIGLAWSFLNPLLMLAIYTFVFSVVFKARWGADGADDKVGFAIVLFVGMIVHGLFAECVNRASGLIIANSNYVKKIVFPLEILPSIALGSALFHAAVSTIVLLLAMLMNGTTIHMEALWAPVLVLPLAAAALGFSWFLASLGVFLRDVGQLTGIFTTALLFLSPVFYPVAAMPEEFRAVMQVNPLTSVIEQMREAVIWGHAPDWSQYLIQSLVGILLAWAGFWWFQKTRKGFADVL